MRAYDENQKPPATDETITVNAHGVAYDAAKIAQALSPGRTRRRRP